MSVGTASGVLTLGKRGWVVANDAEVRLLEPLRAEGVARNRLWALAAALDAGVVDAAGLRRLNGRLAAITAVERPDRANWLFGDRRNEVNFTAVITTNKEK